MLRASSSTGTGSTLKARTLWLMCQRFPCTIIWPHVYLFVEPIVSSPCSASVCWHREQENKCLVPLGFPTLPGRQENGHNNESRGRLVLWDDFFFLIGSSRKALMVRLTFEQRPEQAGLFGGSTVAESRKNSCEGLRQKHAPCVWGAARGPA